MAFCEAVYDGEKTVERVTCRLASSLHEVNSILKGGDVAMLVDPEGRYIHSFSHEALVDAIEAISRMAAQLGDRLVEAEINPVFVRAQGQGVSAADGVVVLA